MEELIIGAILVALAAGGVVYLAMRAKRDPALQQKVLDALPDAGDKAWNRLVGAIPIDDHEARDRLRAEMEAVDAKADAWMVNRLRNRGYTVAKKEPT